MQKLSIPSFSVASPDHHLLFFFRCTEVLRFDPIDVNTLINENGSLYNGTDRRTRLKLSSRELRDLPLLDDEGQEIPVYNSRGFQVPRRVPVENFNDPTCGVLMELKSIQGLFNPDTSSIILDDAAYSSSQYEDPFVRVEAYPLGFLKMAGNVKASGVPHCFYPLLTKINKSLRRNHEAPGENAGEDDPEAPYLEPSYRALKPVSSQFYNYMAHRVASRAGRHDAQQGTVTAAISGAHATTDKDKKTAQEKQKYCKRALPSERFHARINSIQDCPNDCRAELVYFVDVRALNEQSGSYIYNHIIHPLAEAWSEPDIRSGVKDYIIVFKPNVRSVDLGSKFRWCQGTHARFFRSSRRCSTGCRTL
jgi:hypothetical protein